ncbi:MAG TPA: ABC transporter transmembrane domain-containing protein, partial [Rhodocyclaceae bacterium]|nr:ABC transporter transmembrane domain-containing protein [Rhodocyclaceae bacterium]
MRRSPSGPPPAPATGDRHDWQTIRQLLPYLWAYKGRVLFALVCLISAKFANVSVPLIFKRLVDDLDLSRGQALIVVPAALLLAYGVLRFSTSLFTELREIIFARVTQEAVREISLQVFHHLHALSLRFHLERQTGGLTRDIERGTRSIGSLISYTLYSILPTLVEIGLVMGILLTKYEPSFAAITAATLTCYIVFTVRVTHWRTALRRRVNELDSAANARAIDSLINFETVKYFNNEAFETRRYDAELARWTEAQIRNQQSLSLLNMGQAAIIAVGVTAMMWRAALGVAG